MRILPCSNRGCRGRASLPGGEPYYTSSWPSTERQFQYRCATCNTSSTITRDYYLTLPQVSLHDLHTKHGVCNWGILQDLHDLTSAQTGQLFAAGWTAQDIAALPDPPRRTR